MSPGNILIDEWFKQLDEEEENTCPHGVAISRVRCLSCLRHSYETIKSIMGLEPPPPLPECAGHVWVKAYRRIYNQTYGDWNSPTYECLRCREPMR